MPATPELLACRACKKQKRRCDKAVPKCSLCRRTGRTCEYSEAPDPPPTAAVFAALRTRLGELEQRLDAHTTPSTIVSDEESPAAPHRTSSDDVGGPHKSGSSTVSSSLSTLPYHHEPEFPAMLFLDIDCFIWSGLQLPDPSVGIPTSSSRLDILLNNAGIMGHPPALTRDGYEVQFGTNFIGHALLIRLLLPLLLKNAKTDDIRIVSLTSGSHALAPSDGIRFSSLKTTGEKMSPLERYGQSKLANILYAKKLASRYKELKIVSVNPGMVNTGLTSVMGKGNMFLRLAVAVVRPFQGVPVEDGVRNQLWAAVSPDVASGEFYSPVGVTGKGSAKTRDEKLENELWEWVEKEIDAFLAKS